MRVVDLFTRYIVETSSRRIGALNAASPLITTPIYGFDAAAATQQVICQRGGRYTLHLAPSGQVIPMTLRTSPVEEEIVGVLNEFWYLTHYKNWWTDTAEKDLPEQTETLGHVTLQSLAADGTKPCSAKIKQGVVFEPSQDTAIVLEFNPQNPPGYVLHSFREDQCAVILFKDRLRILRVTRSDESTWLDLLANDD